MKSCITCVEPKNNDDINIICDRLDTTHAKIAENGTLWILVTDTEEPQGLPWFLAFQLRSRGWWLRQDIISSLSTWGTHHYFFMFARSAQYYYNQEALREESVTKTTEKTKIKFGGNKYGDNPEYIIHSGKVWQPTGFRNKRSVWTIQANNLSEEYQQLATFACKASTEIGDEIIDPFDSYPITESVAKLLQRKFRRN